MKLIGNILVSILLVAVSGCMAPNFTRLIPKNKDAHIKIYNPIYGYVEIDTRVNPNGGNPLPPLAPPRVETAEPGQSAAAVAAPAPVLVASEYTLVRAERNLGSGVSEPALYQRAGDPNNLYMRALGSDMWLRIPKR